MNIQEIRICLQSDDEEIRRAALQKLVGVPISASLNLVFSAMGDESWRVRKESVDVFLSSSPDETAVENLLELLRNEDNAGLRNSAAEAVIRLGTAAALPLIKMAKDPDADVRKFIVDLMGAIGDSQFVQPLLSALHDADVNVASAAAEHLGSSGDTRVAKDLIQAIIDNQAVLFRFSALGALSTLEKPSTVPEEILRLADQDFFRKAVYDCLGSISDDSSVSFLKNGLCSLQRSARSAAIKAIHKIYGRSGSAGREKIIDEFRSLNGSDAVSGLLLLFDNRDSSLTEALIWCSGATGDIRFIPLLIELFEDERFAESALRSLNIYGQENISNVAAYYSEANSSARSAICTLIGEGAYFGYSGLIDSALKDNSAQVRRAAIISVAKLDMISSVQSLVNLVDDSEPEVTSSAVSSLQALARIDPSEILKIAKQFSVSKDQRHRRYASLLLSSLGEYDRLLLLAMDEDPYVRQDAVSAIGTLHLKSSVTALMVSLVDENPDVRIAAADAIGNLGEFAGLNALELALDDEDDWVRCAALKAISKIDQDHSLSVIKRIHSSAGGLLMITCLQILETNGGSDAQSIISSYITNPDPDVSRQASMSLERSLSQKQYSGCA